MGRAPEGRLTRSTRAVMKLFDVGAVLLQVRELVKDLTYRNRLEAEERRLALARLTLEIAKTHRLAADDLQRLAAGLASAHGSSVMYRPAPQVADMSVRRRRPSQ
jgi:hypothetical protein